jgi:hypothetical protein
MTFKYNCLYGFIRKTADCLLVYHFNIANMLKSADLFT